MPKLTQIQANIYCKICHISEGYSLFSTILQTLFRLLQKSYVDAIVINYMRNRIVEELKVERLTTRRGHHR